MNHEALTPANSLPSIGKQLRAARSVAQMTQWQVAEAVGTTEWHYWQIENEQIKPRLSTLERIAAALGLRVALVADSEEDV